MDITGLIVSVNGLFRVAPSPSTTLTVNVAVPAAVGVPLTVTVPPTGSTVRLARVNPVVPPLNPLTSKVVYGVSPPVTVNVWLYKAPAVHAGSEGVILSGGKK